MRKLFPVLMLLFALLLTAPPAGAQTNPPAGAPTNPPANFDQSGCQGRYVIPSHLLVTCQPGWQSANDQLDIYFGADVDTHTPWRETALAHTGTWVFHRGSNAAAALIIVFSHLADGTTIAHLFDDQNGDNHVAYHLNSAGTVVLDESGQAAITVIAKDGWWQRGSVVNYNLDIRVDGPIRASHGAGFQGYLPKLQNDGRADFSIRVADQNHNGHPEFQLTRLLAPLPSLAGIYRSEMIGDTADAEYSSAGVIWPYLAAIPWGYNQPYHKSYPPIQVDWQAAKVVAVGEFVASRGGEHNWFSYSFLPVKDDTLNQVDFEQPMAFYDLADNHDGLPELMVRFVHYTAGDPFSPAQLHSASTSVNEIRYAWSSHARREARWDYTIGTAGTQEITTTVNLPGLSVLEVPYAQIPTWVWQQNWAYATFIAAEQPSYLSSEGLYEWSTTEGVLNYQGITTTLVPGSAAAQVNYLSGRADQAPASYYTTMPQAMRGEYGTLGGKVNIYLSTVDHRLHLLNASQGVWNVDGHTQMIYANLGGEYLNQWLYQQDGNTTRSLRWAAGYYAYTDTNKVTIAEGPAQAASLITTPPANHQEWQALGQALSAVQAQPLPVFPAIGDGRQVTFAGATLNSYHAAASGFSCILRLKQMAARANGKFSWSSLLAPGDYLLNYDRSSGFRIRPARPAQLAATLIVPGTAYLLQPLGLQLEVSNTGDADATAHLTMRAVAFGATTALTTASIIVAGGSRVQLPLTWMPKSVGSTALTLQLGDALAFTTQLEVNPTLNPGLGDLTATIPDQLLGLLLAMLIIIPVVGAALVFTAWKPPATKPTIWLRLSKLGRAATRQAAARPGRCGPAKREGF